MVGRDSSGASGCLSMIKSILEVTDLAELIEEEAYSAGDHPEILRPKNYLMIVFICLA